MVSSDLGADGKEPSVTRAFATAILLPLVLAGCVVTKNPGAPPGSTSPKLALSTYYEEGTQLAIIVGTRPAVIRKNGPFLPIEVAVVNKGVPGVTLSRESFVMVDRQGRSFPVVSPDELKKSYGSRDLDRRLTELPDMVPRKYPAPYVYERSNFTPSFADGIERNLVTLGRFNYLVDTVYFPNPGVEEDGGPYDLLVRVPELPDRFVVSFSIGGE
jgi:hypothetical protein